MTGTRPAPRLHRTAGLYAGVRLFGQGTEFLAFLIFARRLGATEFGQLAVPFLICRYAGLLADWGATIRGTRAVARESDAVTIRALVARRYQVTAGLIVLYLLACAAIGRVDLAPLGATIAARGLNRDWVALGRERVLRSGTSSMIQGGSLVAAALVTTSLAGAVAGIALAYIAGTVYSVAANRLEPSERQHRLPVRHANWMLLATLADQVCLTADTILLSALRSATEAGIYAAVYRLPNAWMTLTGLLTAGILPGLARHVRRDPSLLPYLRRRAMRAGSLAAGLILALLPASVWLVPVLFGADYEAGRQPLAILLVASAVTASTVALTPLYWATKPDRPLALWYSTMAAANVVANLLLIPAFGMKGASSVTLATAIAVSGFLIVGTRPVGVRDRAGMRDDQELGNAEVAEQRRNELLDP